MPNTTKPTLTGVQLDRIAAGAALLMRHVGICNPDDQAQLCDAIHEALRPYLSRSDAA